MLTFTITQDEIEKARNSLLEKIKKDNEFFEEGI